MVALTSHLTSGVGLVCSLVGMLLLGLLCDAGATKEERFLTRSPVTS